MSDSVKTIRAIRGAAFDLDDPDGSVVQAYRLLSALAAGECDEYARGMLSAALALLEPRQDADGLGWTTEDADAVLRDVEVIVQAWRQPRRG